MNVHFIMIHLRGGWSVVIERGRGLETRMQVGGGFGVMPGESMSLARTPRRVQGLGREQERELASLQTVTERVLGHSEGTPQLSED